MYGIKKTRFQWNLDFKRDTDWKVGGGEGLILSFAFILLMNEDILNIKNKGALNLWKMCM